MQQNDSSIGFSQHAEERRTQTCCRSFQEAFREGGGVCELRAFSIKTKKAEDISNLSIQIENSSFQKAAAQEEECFRSSSRPRILWLHVHSFGFNMPVS